MVTVTIIILVIANILLLMLFIIIIIMSVLITISAIITIPIALITDVIVTARALSLLWERCPVPGQAGAAKLCLPDPIPGRGHPDPWGEGDRGAEAVPREDGGVLQAAEGQGGEAVRGSRHRKFPLNSSCPQYLEFP